MNKEEELLSEEMAGLMRERKILKSKLRYLDEKLKDTDQKVKDFMKTEGHKTIITKGLKITYSKPRDYEAITNKKVAMAYLKEHRSDLITTRSGYERLTVSLSE